MRGGVMPELATRMRRTRLRSLLRGLAFISPNLALFMLFTLGPALFTLALAFFRWDPFSTPTFIGFENFNRLFADSSFWYYLGNTLAFMSGLPLAMAGSLFLAVLLSQKLRGLLVYRTLFYLPTITNGAALYLLWRVMYNKEAGLVNGLLLPVLQAAGVRGHDGAAITSQGMPDWLADAWTIGGHPFYLAKPALIAMGMWVSVGGGNMVLYLAALAGVPPELYEAAEIDGASPWRRFWDITWPMIAPTTFFIIVMGTIGGLQGGFEMAYLMTHGGPEDSTTTVGYYIFAKAFVDCEFGYAAAISFVLFAVIVAVTMLNWRFGARARDY
jgi:multiple sugar transport system permease protein